MSLLAAGIGKAPTTEQVSVYFELLADLPLEALQFAAKRALLEHEFATIPPVGMLRRLAVEFQVGGSMTSGRAWEICRAAVRKFGFYAEAEGLRSLPPDAAAVMRQIGWQNFCDSENPDALRARFLEFWSQQEKHGRRNALLPEKMRGQLNSVAAEAVRKISEARRLPEAG